MPSTAPVRQYLFQPIKHACGITLTAVWCPVCGLRIGVATHTVALAVLCNAHARRCEESETALAIDMAYNGSVA